MGSEPQWPEAVIFDLDGTLADTVLDLAAALNQTLAELDLPPHPPQAGTANALGADAVIDHLDALALLASR
jgi:phosphoglycolate phosphatase